MSNLPPCDWCGECDWCAMLGFDWPCDRHEAHGPHPVYCPEHGPEGLAWVCDGTQECPGVNAHPLTMIGRQA